MLPCNFQYDEISTSDLTIRDSVSVSGTFVYEEGVIFSYGVGVSDVHKSALSLDLVENITLSTWSGSSNVTTIGTLTSGSVPVGLIAGLGTLATQNGTFSGNSSGTNTGDQDISAKIENITGLVEAGDNITITGTGTTGDPCVISASAGGATPAGVDGDLQTKAGSSLASAGFGGSDVLRKSVVVSVGQFFPSVPELNIRLGTVGAGAGWGGNTEIGHAANELSYYVGYSSCFGAETAAGSDGVAVGWGAIAGERGIRIGRQNRAAPGASNDAIAIGYRVVAGNGAIAIGKEVNAPANTVVIGDAAITHTYLRGVVETLGQSTVDTLPDASLNHRQRWEVVDALSPVRDAIVVSGGSSECVVRSNGTDWIVTELL